MPFDIGSVIAKVDADITGFKKGMSEAEQAANGFGSKLKSIGSGIADFGKQAAVFTGIATAAVVAFGKQSVDAYSEAEAAQAQLEHAVIAVTHATKDQLAQTMALATELQNKGVLDDDAIKTGLAQLSTFGLSNKAVQKLGGSLADLAVNQFGVNAGGQELSQTANMIAKALNGQFGVLEKSGIRFTALQRKIIETGTEMEKVKAINEGFAQNLKYTNEVALKTLEGQLAAVNVKFGNFKETVGQVLVTIGQFMVTGDDSKGSLFDSINALIPDDATAEVITNFIIGLREALVKIGQWISANQELVITFFKGLAIAVAALLVIGTVAGAIMIATNPLFLFIAAVTALYVAWENNFLGIKTITEFVVSALMSVWNNVLLPMIQFITTFISEHWNQIKLITDGTFKIIIGIFQVFSAIVGGIFFTLLALLKGNWGEAWELIKDALKMAWEGIKNIFGGALNFIRGWGGQLLEELVRPFKDAWNAIKELVNKIKDALDFTKRHSPSILDIVKSGVGKVNEALGDLSVSGTLNANAAGLAVSNGGNQNSTTVVRIDMAGAFIGDSYGANQMAEKLGDGIIKRLQNNIRI